MKRRSTAYTTAFCYHFDEEGTPLKFLAPHVKEKEFGKIDQQNLKILFSTKEWLKKVHYSWLYPFFSKLPHESRPLFLPLLTPTQVQGLEKNLSISPPCTSLPYFAQLFVYRFLKKELGCEKILPQELIPKNSVSPLLEIKWSLLIETIDLLGVYDLVEELKQIIDKQLIQKVHSSLSQNQQKFLSFLTKQPVRWKAPKLNLKKWDQSPNTLKNLVHRRGLIRLAKGVKRCDPHFHWHLFHRLDVGRARILEDALKEPVDSNLIDYFEDQLIKILQRLG